VSVVESAGCVYNLALKSCVKKASGKDSQHGFAATTGQCHMEAAYEVAEELKEVIVTDTSFSRTTRDHCDNTEYPFDTESKKRTLSVMAGTVQTFRPIVNEILLKRQTPDVWQSTWSDAADTTAKKMLDSKDTFYKGAVCDTLALAVISKLKAKGVGLRMEWVMLRYYANSGHSVVVVNRATGSALNDPTGWGADAFLIDLWFRNMQRQLDVAPHGIYYGQAMLTEMTDELASCFDRGTVPSSDDDENKLKWESGNYKTGGFGVKQGWDTTWISTSTIELVANPHNTAAAWVLAKGSKKWTKKKV